MVMQSGDEKDGSECYLSFNPLTWWRAIMTKDVPRTVLGLVVVPFLSHGSDICWNRTLKDVIDEELIHISLLEADRFICLFSLD